MIALNGLAATYSIERDDTAHRMTVEQIAEHESLVDRARALAPNDATALLTWGRIQIMRGRADLALWALEKANRLVPSYPAGHLFIAQALLMLGRTDEVRARVERAVELSANEPRRTSNAYSLGAEAALMRGDDEAARDLARRGIAALPSNAFAHATLAAVDALGGRTDEAVAAMGAFRNLWPDAHRGPLRRLAPIDPSDLSRAARTSLRGLAQGGIAAAVRDATGLYASHPDPVEPSPRE